MKIVNYNPFVDSSLLFKDCIRRELVGIEFEYKNISLLTGEGGYNYLKYCDIYFEERVNLQLLLTEGLKENLMPNTPYIVEGYQIHVFHGHDYILTFKPSI